MSVIEQCCFNSDPDPFNGQTVDLILKPPKFSIESRPCVKKADLEHYWNDTLLLWQQHSWSRTKKTLKKIKLNKTPQLLNSGIDIHGTQVMNFGCGIGPKTLERGICFFPIVSMYIVHGLGMKNGQVRVSSLFMSESVILS